LIWFLLHIQTVTSHLSPSGLYTSPPSDFRFVSTTSSEISICQTFNSTLTHQMSKLFKLKCNPLVNSCILTGHLKLPTTPQIVTEIESDIYMRKTRTHTPASHPKQNLKIGQPPSHAHTLPYGDSDTKKL